MDQKFVRSSGGMILKEPILPGWFHRYVEVYRAYSDYWKAILHYEDPVFRYERFLSVDAESAPKICRSIWYCFPQAKGIG